MGKGPAPTHRPPAPPFPTGRPPPPPYNFASVSPGAPFHRPPSPVPRHPHPPPHPQIYNAYHLPPHPNQRPPLPPPPPSASVSNIKVTFNATAPPDIPRSSASQPVIMATCNPNTVYQPAPQTVVYHANPPAAAMYQPQPMMPTAPSTVIVTAGATHPHGTIVVEKKRGRFWLPFWLHCILSILCPPWIIVWICCVSTDLHLCSSFMFVIILNLFRIPMYFWEIKPDKDHGYPLTTVE